jgi:HlyD family secretion protein
MKTYYFTLFLLMVLILPSCKNENNKSDAYGNFEVDETTISAQVNGELLQFKIEEGITLKAGDTIGLIDTLDLHLKLDEIKANRDLIGTQSGNVVAQLDVTKNEIANLEREHKRLLALFKDKAATQKQLDDIEGAIKVANSKTEVIEVQNPNIAAQLKTIDAKEAQLKEQIQKSILINPVNGTVITRIAMQHELAIQGKPLYTIADLTQMNLKIFVSGSQLPQLKIGQQVKVMIDKNAKSNSTLSGTITWISSEAEFTPKNIQTKEERVAEVYAVKIRVVNDGSIKSGMPGEIKL